MMTHAYDEIYLNDGMKNLAEAFDYAVNDCKLDADQFMSLFIASGYAHNFEIGDPRIISGISGTELVIKVINKAKLNIKLPTPRVSYKCSREYWAGWVISYYQWVKGTSFHYIASNISINTIINMYHPLHEASEEKFVETLDNVINSKNKTKV